MSTTYRQHQDTRDGKIYNCVLMPDGKWWAAENLAWAGTGYDLQNDVANRAIYGRLYEYSSITSAVPSGTHPATRGEWNALIAAIPGTNECTVLKANSPLWSPNTGTDDYGFSALPSGQLQMPAYWTTGAGYFWVYSTVDQAYEVRMYSGNSSLIGPSAEDQLHAKSVRFVVDVFNYPTYPTPSIYPASGTLQGVQLVVIQGSGTIRYTLDGSEPTASSPVYAGPFRLASSATVKAKAFQNSMASDTSTSVLVIQGDDFLKIPSYTAAVLPLLLEQYKGDNP